MKLQFAVRINKQGSEGCIPPKSDVGNTKQYHVVRQDLSLDFSVFFFTPQKLIHATSCHGISSQYL